MRRDGDLQLLLQTGDLGQGLITSCGGFTQLPLQAEQLTLGLGYPGLELRHLTLLPSPLHIVAWQSCRLR